VTSMIFLMFTASDALTITSLSIWLFFFTLLSRFFPLRLTLSAYAYCSCTTRRVTFACRVEAAVWCERLCYVSTSSFTPLLPSVLDSFIYSFTFVAALILPQIDPSLFPLPPSRHFFKKIPAPWICCDIDTPCRGQKYFGHVSPNSSSSTRYNATPFFLSSCERYTQSAVWGVAANVPTSLLQHSAFTCRPLQQMFRSVPHS
jgi:hypothetical protein